MAAPVTPGLIAATVEPVGLTDLVAQYERWVATAIDEDGISLHHAFVIQADGTLAMHALDLPPPQAWQYILRLLVVDQQPREMIFALDRYTRPGQGTTLGDLMAGVYFIGPKPRPFVIEYQHDPRIVKPICWDNAFWNAALAREVSATMQDMGLFR